MVNRITVILILMAALFFLVACSEQPDTDQPDFLQVTKAISNDYDATPAKVNVAIDREAQHGGLGIKVDRWDPEPTHTIGCEIRCLGETAVTIHHITWQVKYPSGYNSQLYRVQFASPKTLEPGATIRVDLGGSPQGYMAELKITIYSTEDRAIGPFMIVLKESDK